MNDDFVTDGIKQDRYLKATRLADRFETEIRRELTRAGDSIVADNPTLFRDGAKANWNNHQTPSRLLAFARVDYVMDRITSPEDPEHLKFNLGLRWVEPDKYGWPNIDGALCMVSYKIKNMNKTEYEHVKTHTKEGDWQLHFAENVYSNAPGVIYYPVTDADSLTKGLETIGDHFGTYGSEYGVTLD